MLRNDLYKPWFAGESDWGFEIIDGEFSGVVVQIEKVEFVETEDGNIQAEYHVVSKPETISDEYVAGDLFKAVFQNIVVDIITEAVTNYEQNRNDNTEESSS